MIDTNPVNSFMTTISITRPLPFPRTYTNLWGEQGFMYGLNMDHKQLVNTLEEKYQDQRILIQ